MERWRNGYKRGTNFFQNIWGRINFWTAWDENRTENGRGGAVRSSSGTAGERGYVKRGAGDELAAEWLEWATGLLRREVHGATDNAHSEMVDAAMLNSCGRVLIGDVTAGRLAWRRAIAASSFAVPALAGLWARVCDGTETGEVVHGVKTEYKMVPYEMETAPCRPGWRQWHSSICSTKNLPGMSRGKNEPCCVFFNETAVLNKMFLSVKSAFKLTRCDVCKQVRGLGLASRHLQITWDTGPIMNNRSKMTWDV